MLHILLLILKIIGIILAVILGILILLVCIVLFVPIRYEISAKCDGTIDSLKAKVKATWLLHLVRADVFLKGKKLKWQVRLAWFKRSNQKKTNAAGETNRKEEKSNEAKENEPQKVEETVVKNEVSEKASEVSEEKCENHSEEVKEDRLEEDSKECEEKHKTDSETDKTVSQESEKESVSDKIKKIIEKIKGLSEKKEKITDFLTDKSHINAFKKAKRGLFVLLKRLKPKKIDVKLRFGFEDPATTGKLLGVFGMLYPFLDDTTEIVPDFENQVLEGNVYLKGRIRFSHFAALAFKLLLSKDVRRSYKDIRNFKL